MSKLLGFGLILSGLALGGVGVPLSAGTSSSAADVSARAAAPDRELFVEKSPREGFGWSIPGLSAPPVRIAASDAPLGQRAPHTLKVPEPRRAVRPPALVPARKPLGAFETVVVPEDPAALARLLQDELARVGCYEGPVNGSWTMASRRAMKAFTDRVNATLPIDKPDIILLSLVKAEAGRVCGKACPSGQSAVTDGRCMPQAIVAQSARKAAPHKVALAPRPDAPAAGPSKPATENHAAPLPVAPVPEFLAGFFSENQRMALAGPKDPAPQAAPIVVPEKDADAAKRARKRDRKEPTAAKSAGFGQTRWARDFFRTSGTF